MVELRQTGAERSGEMNESGDEKPEDVWKDDLFGRKNDADYIERFAKARIKARAARGEIASCVLNIDAGWGFGKTFFMERMAKQLKAKGYLVAEINAWQDDHSDDPFISVLAAIHEAVETLMEGDTEKVAEAKRLYGVIMASALPIAKKAGVGAISQLLKKYTGVATEEYAEVIEAANDGRVQGINQRIDLTTEGLLEERLKAQESIDTFKTGLASLLKDAPKLGSKRPLFVLIDELDRCRPPYAIAMLERIKHLFEIDDVVFLIATSTDQLTHSIAGVYGDGFDAVGYLRRFFERTYRFEEPDQRTYVEAWIESRPELAGKFYVPEPDDFSRLVGDIFRCADLSLRDRDYCLDMLEDISLLWERKFPIIVAILVPFILAHQKGIRPAFSKGFVNEIGKIELMGGCIIKGGMNKIFLVAVFENVNKFNVDGHPNKGIVQMANNLESDDGPQSYLRKALLIEYHERGGIRQPDTLMSILFEYPDLVLQAGRMALPIDKYTGVPVGR
jgi:KAP-like P-loop domain-containing protein